MNASIEINYFEIIKYSVWSDLIEVFIECNFFEPIHNLILKSEKIKY